jgi:hypothetical protein
MQFSHGVLRRGRAVLRGVLTVMSIGCALVLIVARPVDHDPPGPVARPAQPAGAVGAGDASRASATPGACPVLADLAGRLASAVAVPPSPSVPAPGGDVQRATQPVLAAAEAPAPDRTVSAELAAVDDAAVAARCAAPP